MPFPNPGGRLLLVGAILVGALAPAQAQRPPRVATRIDSLRAVRDGAFSQSLPAYYTAVLTFASGKRVPGYVEVDSYLSSWNLFDRMYCYEVPRGHKAFADLMTAMLADFPALAARVKAYEKGAGFDDMPMLLHQYNAHFTAK